MARSCLLAVECYRERVQAQEQTVQMHLRQELAWRYGGTLRRPGAKRASRRLGGGEDREVTGQIMQGLVAVGREVEAWEGSEQRGHMP